MDTERARFSRSTENSRKSILARGCDPVASLEASRSLPLLLGSPEYVPTHNDEDFLEMLESRDWSVVFFAPGACRFDAANMKIPGGNAATEGWTLDQYRQLVRDHQGDIPIVETLDERDTVVLLEEALRNAAETR